MMMISSVKDVLDVIDEMESRETKVEEIEEEEFLECRECGCVIYGNNYIDMGDGEYICADCYDEGYFTCEDCGEIVPLDEAVLVYDGYERERYVCDDCADSNYTPCYACGEYHRYTYTGEGGEEYCHECINEYPEEPDELDNDQYCGYYADGWDDEPVFRPLATMTESNPVGRGNRYFGIEFEMECRNRAEAIMDIRGLYDSSSLVYFKYDGSLDREDGLEMVTQPMTMAYLESKKGWLDDVFNIADNCGKYNSGATGTHVHVNRESFGIDEMERTFTIGKTIVLFNTLWHSFFKQVCRRDWTKGEESYGGLYYSKKNPDIHVSLDVSRETNVFRFAHAMGRYTADVQSRYYAVNIMPSHTVEFRLFGYMESADDVMAVVELIDKVIEFARTSTLKQCYDCFDWHRIFRDNKASENLLRFIEGGLDV